MLLHDIIYFKSPIASHLRVAFCSNLEKMCYTCSWAPLLDIFILVSFPSRTAFWSQGQRFGWQTWTYHDLCDSSMEMNQSAQFSSCFTNPSKFHFGTETLDKYLKTSAFWSFINQLCRTWVTFLFLKGEKLEVMVMQFGWSVWD